MKITNNSQGSCLGSYQLPKFDKLVGMLVLLIRLVLYNINENASIIKYNKDYYHINLCYMLILF